VLAADWYPVAVGGLVQLVAEERPGDTHLATKLPVLLGRVRGDQQKLDVQCVELFLQLLVALNLNAAERSPIPAVEEQQRVLLGSVLGIEAEGAAVVGG
jgi:hypothetical protein